MVYCLKLREPAEQPGIAALLLEAMAEAATMQRAESIERDLLHLAKRWLRQPLNATRDHVKLCPGKRIRRHHEHVGLSTRGRRVENVGKDGRYCDVEDVARFSSEADRGACML